MLSPKQREQVEYLIFVYIGIVPASATVQELFGPELAHTYPGGVNGHQLAVWLLDRCLALPQPDLFIKVVTTVDVQGELVEVHHLVRRLRQDASLWRTQVLDELWVPAEWPFIDRQELRRALTAIADGVGPAAITIEASEGHGKRTMCAYIQHLARRHRGFRPVVAELRHAPDPGVLDALVAELRMALELDLNDDTTHLDPERRAVVSARKLTRDEEALLAPEPVWLVANVVEVTGLEEGLLRFIDELLGQVQNTRVEDLRLHVVLLSNEVARLGLTNLPDLTARHVLPEVDEAAVTEWLAAAEPGKPEQMYATATAMVLRNVEARLPAPSLRLRWLAQHCIQAQRRLARTS